MYGERRVSEELQEESFFSKTFSILVLHEIRSQKFPLLEYFRVILVYKMHTFFPIAKKGGVEEGIISVFLSLNEGNRYFQLCQFYGCEKLNCMGEIWK